MLICSLCDWSHCKICQLPIIKGRSVVLVICLCNNTNTQAFIHKKNGKSDFQNQSQTDYSLVYGRKSDNN